MDSTKECNKEVIETNISNNCNLIDENESNKNNNLDIKLSDEIKTNNIENNKDKVGYIQDETLNSEQKEVNNTTNNNKPLPKTKNKKIEKIRNKPRDRTSVFESKINQKPTNKIVATGIGDSKFNSLLSMFDRSKINDDNNNKNEEKRNSNIEFTNKINTSLFEKKDSEINNNINKEHISTNTGLSIKERMELLKKEGDKTINKGQTVTDPILEKMKQESQEVEEDDESNNENSKDDFCNQDNLSLSDDNIDNNLEA